MKTYIEQNKERFFEELFSLLRIPSVSALPEHKADMQRCAERLCELLLEAGADRAEVSPSRGNPVVYAEKIIDLCDKYQDLFDVKDRKKYTSLKNKFKKYN